ncbi:MAG: M50 family metallopeptidase [Anaerolineaceae bacterium]
METILTILQFALAFGLLVFFHEFGHFLASKWLGIEVEEFGFGLPPRLFRIFNWRGTDVTVNAVPFGAFVRPKGETDVNEPGSILAAPAWKRLLVMLAGPLMNFIVGILVLIVMYLAIGSPIDNKVLITEVVPASPAQSVGLLKGDIVTEVNGTVLINIEDFQNRIRQAAGTELSLTVLRETETMTLKVTPRLNPPAGQGALGVGISNPLEPMPFFSAVGNAFETFGIQVAETVKLPFRLIRGEVAPEDARMVGIKGIYDIFNQANTMDATAQVVASTPLPFYRMSLISVLSIALGITNLLPVPPTDGGQIVLLLPELLFKKRIPQTIVNRVNSIGYFLLIALMLYITFQDIINPVIKP